MSRDTGSSETAAVRVLADAVLDAANLAGIGVTVSEFNHGAVRNLYVSEAAVAILGHPREVILSRPALDFVAPEERQSLIDMTMRREAGESLAPRILESIVVQESGARVPVAFASIRMKLGNEPGSVSFFWDISSRRKTEAMLQTEEARSRRLIDCAPDGIVISRNGLVLEVNPAAARMLGFDGPEDLKGKSLHDFMSADAVSIMRERVGRVLGGARLEPREYEARRKDGGRVVAEITAMPFPDAEGMSVIAFARDVTERARMTAQLARTERLAALGTLAAGVAHEINNPLTTVFLGLEALERRMIHIGGEGERAEALDLLSEVRRGTERVAGIVRELRAFSREGEERALAVVEPLTALGVAERMAIHQIRHRGQYRTSLREVPPVVGSQGRLEQVFVNLLLNAAHALPEGRPGNWVTTRSFVADGRVVVEIEDNGIGIAPEALGRIFDPFFTTKPVGVGTGLGLFVTHGIITGMGGEVMVESEVGRGTVFRVRLPPAPPAAIEAARRAAHSVAPRSDARVPRPRARILVVDDEVTIIGALRELLGHHHELMAVTCVEDALAAIDGGQAFDLVLCDLMMPGLTGIDLHAHVAVVDPQAAARIVFMTGGAFTEKATAFMNRVPNRVLEKPFTSEKVEALLDQLGVS